VLGREKVRIGTRKGHQTWVRGGERIHSAEVQGGGGEGQRKKAKEVFSEGVAF